MITVITGTPGAGKTLYAVSKLITPLVGTQVPQEVDGVTTMHPRTIYTNINGLQLDHELVEHGPTWNKDAQDTGHNLGLHNWHEWAKPGSVIVVDEFQKLWPPRPNGASVPPDVSALDTHRHMGVDFILLTQNVMNVDRHVHGLCNRHLHIRRLANMGLATVYEWDMLSKALQFKSAMNRTAWRYKKADFAKYRSAQLHTKQPRSLPGVLWFVLFGILGTSFLAPTVYARLSNRMGDPATFAKPSETPAAASKTTDATKPAKKSDEPPAPAPVTAIGCAQTATHAHLIYSNGKRQKHAGKRCDDFITS
jgi:zona occludens toxin